MSTPDPTSDAADQQQARVENRNLPPIDDELRAIPGAVTQVLSLPKCDLCGRVGTSGQRRNPAPAHYDFRMVSGTWANACHSHYIITRMYERLGTGRGQRLEPTPTPPTPITDDIN